jgi:hypothetical protein
LIASHISREMRSRTTRAFSRAARRLIQIVKTHGNTMTASTTISAGSTNGQ